jgi:hypothetical protein
MLPRALQFIRFYILCGQVQLMDVARRVGAVKVKAEMWMSAVG